MIGFQLDFLELTRLVFEVRPSYLACMELFTCALGKNKLFYGKIFFRVKGSIFDEKYSHFEGDFDLETSQVLIKFGQNPVVLTFKWT